MRVSPTITAMSVLLAAVILTVSPARADTFADSVELPGVQHTTMVLENYGVETFDARILGAQTFTTDFATNGVIVGTFSNVDAERANLYGGADGSGNFASDYSGTFRLTFAQPVTYLGLWISALNSTNYLNFYNGGALVYSFNPAQLLAFVGGNQAYYGNPTANFFRQNPGEPYAFVNFTDMNGTFDQVAVSGYGYETDNFTVGTPLAFSASAHAFDAPEPSPVAVLGLGLIGIGVVTRGMKQRSRECAHQAAP